MTRSHLPTGVFVVLLGTAPAAAQQAAATVGPGAVVVGATGPGVQPQVNTSPYRQPAPTAAARGVNPFGGQPLVMPNPALARPGLRPAPPVAVAPAAPRAPGGVANNPAVLNRGVVVPFPLAIPPAAGAMAANGPAFNPLFVARPGTGSAYYTPPLPAPAQTDEASGSSLSGPVLYSVTGDTSDADGAYNPSAGVVLRPADFRFLPWAW